MPKIFQRKAGGSYYVRIYSGSSERWISLRTPHKREAERRAGKLLYSELPSILKAVVEKPKTTLAFLWETYRASHSCRQLEVDSLVDKARCYEEFCRFARVKHADDITPKLCADYLDREIRAHSSATARHKKTQVASVWGACAVQLDIPNPWLNLPRISTEPNTVRHTVPFEDGQVALILEAIKGKPFEGVVMMSLYTGARLKDAVHMRHEYLQGDIISFLPCKTARKGRPVRLSVHPEILRFFHVGETGYLFPAEVDRYKRSKKKAQVNNFRDVLKRLKIKAEGRGRLSFHSLRSTFITRAELGGVERRKIRAAVGHVEDSQTAQYSQVAMTADDVAKI